MRPAEARRISQQSKKMDLREPTTRDTSETETVPCQPTVYLMPMFNEVLQPSEASMCLDEDANMPENVDVQTVAAYSHPLSDCYLRICS